MNGGRRGPESITGLRGDRQVEKNLRYAWLVLNYALAADIVYRAGFAREAYGRIADLIFIWLGAQLFYLVLELSVQGSLVAVFRLSAVPATVLGIVAAGGLLLLTQFWSGRIILAGAFGLALVAVLALLVVARRRA